MTMVLYLERSARLFLASNLFNQNALGERGIVVSPAAWMFHKGLTFPRRNNASKVYKDLYGIWYVASQLEDFSNKAIEELKSLF